MKLLPKPLDECSTLVLVADVSRMSTWVLFLELERDFEFRLMLPFLWPTCAVLLRAFLLCFGSFGLLCSIKRTFDGLMSWTWAFLRTPQAFVLCVLADSFRVSSRRLALSAREEFVATRGDFWRWLRALVLWLRHEFWFDCDVLRELRACA